MTMADGTEKAIDGYTDVILSNTFTVADALHRLSLVWEHFDSAADTPIPESSLAQSGSDSDVAAITEWEDGFLSALRQQGTEAGRTLSDVREALLALPRLTLYIPVVPDAAGVAELGTWARTHIAERMLLELYADSSAAGGCRFIWNGVLHDYSLQRYFHERQDTALAALNAYADQ